MYRFGFIIEQTLGHITHGNNLQAHISKDQSIEALWGLPAWENNRLSRLLPIYRSNWTVKAGLQARRAVTSMHRKLRLDALFFHTQVTATLSTDLIKNIPSIVSLDATPMQYDDLGEFYKHNKGPAWFESLKYRLNQNCFRNADYLVTWSQWAKNSLVDDYDIDPNKITVVPPGVNVKYWTRPDERNGHNKIVKILFVGNDLQRKGGYDLIKAFRQLRNERQDGWEMKPEIQLHMVTKEKLPKEPGLRVYNDLKPNSPNLKRLYHDCHIFCLPTLGDCLPMVLSEAGAAGMPIVSTAVAAVPEIVIDDETGYLIPPGDIRSLRDALHRLVNDSALRFRLGDKAHSLIEHSHDAERNTDILLILLKQVASGAKT